MDFREIAAVFVDGEQAQSGLADQGDVVAGGGCFGYEGDEHGPGAGDGDGSSAGQGSAWEQRGERRGHGHGAEGFAAYSTAERFRVVDLAREVRIARGGCRWFGCGDGGEVGGCVFAATAGHGGHPATEDVELGGHVESGEVGDGVDGGHVDRPFAVPVGTTARIVEQMFDCRMCWSTCSAGKTDAVEVVNGEGPGEMAVQAQGVFDLVEGIGDGRVVGVAASCADGCTSVVVHVWLDARGGAAVPATVIHSNDWTGCLRRRGVSNESRAALLVRGPAFGVG
jgi:hypothetical protein